MISIETKRKNKSLNFQNKMVRKIENEGDSLKNNMLTDHIRPFPNNPFMLKSQEQNLIHRDLNKSSKGKKNVLVRRRWNAQRNLPYFQKELEKQRSYRSNLVVQLGMRWKRADLGLSLMSLRIQIPEISARHLLKHMGVPIYRLPAWATDSWIPFDLKMDGPDVSESDVRLVRWGSNIYHTQKIK